MYDAASKAESATLHCDFISYTMYVTEAQHYQFSACKGQNLCACVRPYLQTHGYSMSTLQELLSSPTCKHTREEVGNAFDDS